MLLGAPGGFASSMSSVTSRSSRIMSVRPSSSAESHRPTSGTSAIGSRTSRSRSVITLHGSGVAAVLRPPDSVKRIARVRHRSRRARPRGGCRRFVGRSAVRLPSRPGSRHGYRSAGGDGGRAARGSRSTWSRHRPNAARGARRTRCAPVQPGKRQRRSRAMTARRIAGRPPGCASDVEGLGSSGRHDPHHRGVAGEAPCDRRVDHTDVIELGRTGCRVHESTDIDRDRDMRSFGRHGGTVRQVQPLTTDLTERVGPTLRRRAATSDPTWLPHRRPRRAPSQRLAALRNEVAIETNHAVERARGMEPATGAHRIVAIDVLLALDPFAPQCRHASQVRDGMIRAASTSWPRSDRTLRDDVPYEHEDLGRRHRDIAGLQGAHRSRHLLERPGDLRWKRAGP